MSRRAGSGAGVFLAFLVFIAIGFVASRCHFQSHTSCHVHATGNLECQ